MDVKTLCLGVLHLGDATGYEIRKMFEQGLFSHCLEASFGSIYPALNRLAEDRLVVCRDERQNGRPDKKVYSLTAEGRAEFSQAILKDLAEDKYRSEFLFVSVFADLLPPNHMTELVDQQIATMKRLADEITSSSAETNTAGIRFVQGFGQVMHAAAIKYLEENRHLIEKDLTPEIPLETPADSPPLRTI